MPERLEGASEHVAGMTGDTLMAQWVRRCRSDGGESIQIKWRQDGRWQSETFTDVRLAAEFRTAVEVASHHWPEGWVKGEGWVIEPPSPQLTLGEVATGAEGYFAQQEKRLLRGKVKPHPRSDV